MLNKPEQADGCMSNERNAMLMNNDE